MYSVGVAVLALAFSFILIFLLVIFQYILYTKRKQKVYRLMCPELSMFGLFGFGLLSISLLVFALSFFPEQSKSSYLMEVLRKFGLCMGLLSLDIFHFTYIAKCYRIEKIFREKKLLKRVVIRNCRLVSYVLLYTGIDCVLSITWASFSILYDFTKASQQEHFSEVEAVGTWCHLVFPLLLLLYRTGVVLFCLVKAWNLRNVRFVHLNEGYCLIFSSFVQLATTMLLLFCWFGERKQTGMSTIAMLCLVFLHALIELGIQYAYRIIQIQRSKISPDARNLLFLNRSLSQRSLYEAERRLQTRVEQLTSENQELKSFIRLQSKRIKEAKEDVEENLGSFQYNAVEPATNHHHSSSESGQANNDLFNSANKNNQSKIRSPTATPTTVGFLDHRFSPVELARGERNHLQYSPSSRDQTIIGLNGNESEQLNQSGCNIQHSPHAVSVLNNLDRFTVSPVLNHVRQPSNPTRSAETGVLAQSILENFYPDYCNIQLCDEGSVWSDRKNAGYYLREDLLMYISSILS